MNIKRIIKFFYQRIFRGWDDSETWNLDTEFYKWIYPRLKVFKDKTVCFPEKYENLSDWKKELSKRITQLVFIIDCDMFRFQDWSYIPKKEFLKLKKECASYERICCIAFGYMNQDFNKWFGENINYLWW